MSLLSIALSLSLSVCLFLHILYKLQALSLSHSLSPPTYSNGFFMLLGRGGGTRLLSPQVGQSGRGRHVFKNFFKSGRRQCESRRRQSRSQRRRSVSSSSSSACSCLHHLSQLFTSSTSRSSRFKFQHRAHLAAVAISLLVFFPEKSTSAKSSGNLRPEPHPDFPILPSSGLHRSSHLFPESNRVRMKTRKF